MSLTLVSPSRLVRGPLSPRRLGDINSRLAVRPAGSYAPFPFVSPISAHLSSSCFFFPRFPHMIGDKLRGQMCSCMRAIMLTYHILARGLVKRAHPCILYPCTGLGQTCSSMYVISLHGAWSNVLIHVYCILARGLVKRAHPCIVYPCTGLGQTCSSI